MLKCTSSSHALAIVLTLALAVAPSCSYHDLLTDWDYPYVAIPTYIGDGVGYVIGFALFILLLPIGLLLPGGEAVQFASTPLQYCAEWLGIIVGTPFATS